MNVGRWPRFAPGLVGLALAAVFGCGDAASPYRSVLRDQTRAYEEMAELLSTITDEASMRAARHELRKRWERYEAIKERALALPQPMPLDVAPKLQEEGAALSQALARMQQHWSRIKSLPGGEDFLKPFEDKRTSRDELP